MAATKKIEGPVKLISLEVENLKRVNAVAIRFDDANVAQVVGDNGEGKTSVLDALWWGLEGASHIQSEPIRRGTDKALMRLTLDTEAGELIVTRTLRAKGGSEYTHGVTVTTAEGAKFDSPQTVLNTLLGSMAFDLGFKDMQAKDQFAVLSKLVPDFDFDEHAQVQREDYDRRTELGRDLKRAQGAADAIVLPQSAITGSPPDMEAMADELEQAMEHNRTLEVRRDRRAETERALASRKARIEAIAAEIESLTRERETLEEYVEADEDKLAKAEALPDPMDIETIRARHREQREAGAALALKARKLEHQNEAKELQKQIDALTTAMATREAKKRKIIAAAKLPVDGLELGDGDVRLNGEPFEQASDAERLRVSMAIAMAMNPTLRVLRAREADRLDKKSMKLVEQMARENNYLVIMERVLPVAGVGMVVEMVDGSAKETTGG